MNKLIGNCGQRKLSYLGEKKEFYVTVNVYFIKGFYKKNKIK